MMKSKNQKIIVITGDSGVGKDAVKNALEKLLDKKRIDYLNIVTYTDRPKRRNEKEGVDYHFVTLEEFDQMIATKEFAEWVQTGSSRKATSKESLLDNIEDILIWRIDESRAGGLINLPEGTLLSEKESEELRKKTIVFKIDTHDPQTHMDRALKRGMEEEDFEKRVRDESTLDKEFNEVFHTQGKHESGIEYYTLYNENPEPGETVEDANRKVAEEIIEILGLEEKVTS